SRPQPVKVAGGSELIAGEISSNDLTLPFVEHSRLYSRLNPNHIAHARELADSVVAGGQGYIYVAQYRHGAANPRFGKGLDRGDILVETGCSRKLDGKTKGPR